MTPEETSKASGNAVQQLGSKFMTDAATYRRGGELGFEGIDFYVVGRGGALGAVDADVVSAAFVFFNPIAIRDVWERGCQVMEPHEAALEFAACGHQWADDNLPDSLDCARLAELAGLVVTAASPAGAALFGGWRALPEPSADRPKALALHRVNALREHRGALHGAAVLTAGIDPEHAVMLNSPYMANIFGWTGIEIDEDALRPKWEHAAAATELAVGPAYAALADHQRAEFVELVRAARDAVTG